MLRSGRLSVARRSSRQTSVTELITDRLLNIFNHAFIVNEYTNKITYVTSDL